MSKGVTLTTRVRITGRKPDDRTGKPANSALSRDLKIKVGDILTLSVPTGDSMAGYMTNMAAVNESNGLEKVNTIPQIMHMLDYVFEFEEIS